MSARYRVFNGPMPTTAAQQAVTAGAAVNAITWIEVEI